MAISEAFNSFWGTHQVLPIVAAQAGATGGARWQETTETLAHIIAALGLLASWGLLLVGFVRISEGSAHGRRSEGNQPSSLSPAVHAYNVPRGDSIPATRSTDSVRID
jgi:hypothetical protein